MTVVLAIDPGPIQSGIARFDGERVLFAGVLPNEDVLKIVADDRSDLLAIEKFMASGQSLGNESLDTVRWEERFRLSSGDPDMVRMVPRLSVKKVLGLSQRDGDKQVNARLAELIGPKGTKAAPGPCFGVSSHSWAALGVAYAALRL
jgi:hypothetical protein